MTVYFDDWAAGGKERMIEDFNIESSQLEQYEVLIAAYSYENYSGSAFVLLRNINTDLLYEVNGGAL